MRARWFDMPQPRGIVIELRSELEQNLPPVVGIESEIREALINLVFNAVDALAEGGKLTIRTKASPGPAKTRQVDVEVADSGVGLDEETRRRCLEPFFTTKGERDQERLAIYPCYSADWLGQRLIAEGDIPPHVDRVLNKPPKLRELREALAELAGSAGSAGTRVPE